MDRESGNHLPAIILLNAGLLHRVGPNRLYVKIARNLAAMGFVVFRFDFSGIGDSAVRYDNLPIEKSGVSETQGAMDILSATRGVEQFILMGICSGAAFALRTAIEDPRVVGAVPIEGYYGSLPTRYYWSHLCNPISWWRVIMGKKDVRDTIRIGWRIIKSLSAKIKCRFTPAVQTPPRLNLAADVCLLIESGVQLLLVYAKGGLAFYYFVAHEDELRAAMASGRLRVEVIEHSDHTFTSLSAQEYLLKVIQDWTQASVQNQFWQRRSQLISSAQESSLP